MARWRPRCAVTSWSGEWAPGSAYSWLVKPAGEIPAAEPCASGDCRVIEGLLNASTVMGTFVSNGIDGASLAALSLALRRPLRRPRRTKCRNPQHRRQTVLNVPAGHDRRWPAARQRRSSEADAAVRLIARGLQERVISLPLPMFDALAAVTTSAVEDLAGIRCCSWLVLASSAAHRPSGSTSPLSDGRRCHSRRLVVAAGRAPAARVARIALDMAGRRARSCAHHVLA